MQPCFIAAPGTGVGKTLVTTALAWQLRRQGKRVMALKPIISGYDPADEASDTALILKSSGIDAAPETISPWRYRLPLAPNLAAAGEEKPPVELDDLVEFCRSFLFPPPLRGRVREGGHLKESPLSKRPPPPNPLPQGEGEYVLIETIGGIMSPVNDRHTVLDWMAALGWPVIVVTGSYLGSISHTLTSLEVLRHRQLPVRALVVSESQSLSPSLDDTAATLEKFLPGDIPVVKIPRLAMRDELWKYVPPISGICA